MKKLITTVLVAMIAFAAFAGISVTLDTITQFSNSKAVDPMGEIKQGFSISGAEPDDNGHGGDVLGELTATLSKSNAGTASVSIRFRTPSSKYEGAAVRIHGWDITARLAGGLKLSIGNTAYEVFAESVSWEPVSGAGLFEQGANRIYIDYIPDFLSDMEIIAGFSMGEDPKKPWKTFQAAVTYDLESMMKFAFEFHSVCGELGDGTDGGAKAFCIQADYLGIENMEILAGYSLVMESGYAVQHRADVLFNYYSEQFGIEFYDAFIIRCYDGQANGNRLGAKFSYYATEKLTPFVKLNWFRNYGYFEALGGFAWGDWQLSRDYDVQKGNLVVLDAGLGVTLSETFYGSIGAAFRFNLTEGVAKEDKVFWAIPLAITVMF